MSVAVLVDDRTDRRLGDLAHVTGWTVEQVIEAAVLAWTPPVPDHDEHTEDGPATCPRCSMLRQFQPHPAPPGTPRDPR
jgi:transcriptional regulator of met regulon